MKKFGKFVLGLTTAAAAGAGAYYAYKKLTDADSFDEDDFEDDLDEFEIDDEDAPKAPEYVSINNLGEAAKEAAEAAADTASDAAPAEG